MILILTGVTGTGKTTVANALMARTGWQFAEGDDYHSAANRAKMQAGTPLDDADRAPWLAALHQIIADWAAQGVDGVMTCSALKQAYRDTLRGSLPAEAVRFVLLEVPKDVIEERLRRRHHEFMNPKLLESQIATLEAPKDALHIDASATPEKTVHAILATLGVEPAK